MYEYRRRCALRVFPLPFERNNFFSSPRLIPIYDNPQSYLVEKLPLKSSIFPIINNLFLFPRWIQHRLSSCLRQSKKNTARVGDNSTRQEKANRSSSRGKPRNIFTTNIRCALCTACLSKDTRHIRADESTMSHVGTQRARARVFSIRWYSVVLGATRIKGRVARAGRNRGNAAERLLRWEIYYRSQGEREV